MCILLSLSLSLSLSLCVYMYVYIYIYIYVICVYCIYIYIYVYTHTYRHRLFIQSCCLLKAQAFNRCDSGSIEHVIRFSANGIVHVLRALEPSA